MAINHWEKDKRVHVIIGHTGDSFYDADLKRLTIVEAVYKKLKELGYERILFFNSVKKIYFFDDLSYANTKQLLDRAIIEVPKPNRQNLADFMPFGYESVKMVAAPKKEKAKGETINNKPRSLGIQNDQLVLTRLKAVMNNTAFKTALVIDDANNFITTFGRNETGDFMNQVINALNEWDHLPPSNLNTTVFIFSDKQNIQEIEHVFYPYPLYAQFLRKFLQDKEHNYLEIGHPGSGEIKNFLNYLKANKGMNIDFKDCDYIVSAIENYLVVNKKSLNSLELFLNSYNYLSNTFNSAFCDKYLGSKQEKSVFDELDNLVGMAPLKEEIHKIKNRALAEEKSGNRKKDYTYYPRINGSVPNNQKNNRFNLHYAFTGSPGTGKTTAANLMGRVFYELGYLKSFNVTVVTEKDLVDNVLGGTAIKTQKVIDEALGGVLFIDEAYSLFKGKDSNGGQFGDEAIATILENMSRHEGEFSVIIAGYTDEIEAMLRDANPGLARRFSEKIEFPDYNADELLEIFDRDLKKKHYSIDEEAHEAVKKYLEAEERRKTKNFGNAGFVVKLVDSVYKLYCASASANTDFNHVCFQFDDLPNDIKKVANNNLQGEDAFSEITKELDALVGLKSVKIKIKRLYNHILMSDDHSLPGHFAFLGNPGTGKTEVARLIAKILFSLNLLPDDCTIEVRAGDIIGNHIGDSTVKMDEICNKALGKVLFIDEAYALGAKQGERNEYGVSAVNNVLVPFLENHNNQMCAIFAGYKKNMINEFFSINSGLKSRITNIIEFPDYSVEELWEIFEYMMKKTDSRLSYTKEFKMKSIEIFNEAKNSSDFGNARFVRNYLKACILNKDTRLMDTYGKPSNVPDGERFVLYIDDAILFLETKDII